MSRPRYSKLVEFPAHNGDVRCVRIGRSSAGVLATGGDDKKVNLWAVGRTTATLSLSGHQSAVESVAFDHGEEIVAAGGSNGSIKTFELAVGKATRNLSGHKANVSCLEFHPVHNSLISGSMDTNLKHWDMRIKEAAMTLKGHNAPVTHAKFSPDGRWVASASSDGAVKIWDLNAGRLVVDLNPPTKYEVTGLEFHPFEFLLASSSRDKVVRFWDLETFRCIDQTPPEATPVRNIAFHPDGKHMFSAMQDGMRVWSWEPAIQHDFIDVPWYRVADMAATSIRGQQRLLGCSFNSTMVGVFYITLRHVRPFCDDPDFVARESQAAGASVEGNPYHRDSYGTQPYPAAAAASSPDMGFAPQRSGSLQPGMMAAPDAALRNMNLSGARPSASPPAAAMALPAGVSARSIDTSSSFDKANGRPQDAPPFPPMLPPRLPQPTAPAANRYAAAAAGTSHDFGAQASDVGTSMPPRGPDTASLPAVARAVPAEGRGPMVSIGVGVGESLMRGAIPASSRQAAAGPTDMSSRGVTARIRSITEGENPHGTAKDVPVEVVAPALRRESAPLTGSNPMREPSPGGRATFAQQTRDPPAAPSGGDQRYPWQGAADSTEGPSGRNGQGGPSCLAGQGRGVGGGSGYIGGSGLASEHEVYMEAHQRHNEIRAALALRSNALTLLRNFVSRGDWRGAMNCVKRCNDSGAWPALLGVMQARKDAYHLTLVGEVSSMVDAVLGMPSARTVQLGLDVVSTQLHAFGQLIQECSAPLRGGVGIDLKFQERRETAAAAKLALQNLVPRLNAIVRRGDDLADRAKSLAAQLAQL